MYKVLVGSLLVTKVDNINLPMHSVTWECLVLKAGKENPGTLEVMRIV